jgi:hypothetical protein
MYKQLNVNTGSRQLAMLTAALVGSRDMCLVILMHWLVCCNHSSRGLFGQLRTIASSMAMRLAIMLSRFLRYCRQTAEKVASGKLLFMPARVWMTGRRQMVDNALTSTLDTKFCWQVMSGSAILFKQ